MARNGYTSTTTTSFPTVGADGPQVVNTSAEPSPNTTTVRKRGVATSAPVGGPTGHPAPAEISGYDGQALGDLTVQSVARAARHLTICETVDAAGAHPREQEYLDHLFGLNLPRRGRA